MDPNDNNRVVKAITVEDTGYWMGHPFITTDATGKCMFVTLKMSAWSPVAHDVGGIAKINTENWTVTVIPGVRNHLIGMMVTAFFCAGPVGSYADTQRADRGANARFFHKMLERGVYLAPSQFESAFLSLAHTEEDIEATLETARASLQ